VEGMQPLEFIEELVIESELAQLELLVKIKLEFIEQL